MFNSQKHEEPIPIPSMYETIYLHLLDFLWFSCRYINIPFNPMDPMEFVRMGKSREAPNTISPKKTFGGVCDLTFT